MDVELRDALARGFGPEPPHPPVAARVVAGRRAVRRRRLGVVVATAAAVLVVGGTGVLHDVGRDAAPVVTDPTPTPTSTPTPTPWDIEALATYDPQDATLQVRPGATVEKRVDDVIAGRDRSAGLVVTFDGTTSWVVVTASLHDDGRVRASYEVDEPAVAGTTFDAWLDGQRHRAEQVVEVDDAGAIVATFDADLLDEERSVDLGPDFAPPGAATSAALVADQDGTKRWYLSRVIDGSADLLPVPFAEGGRTMEEFLDFARDRYASGVGVR